MKLYHGTDAATAKRIIHEGIKPRLATGHEGNGPTDTPDDLVFLTTAHAAHYAADAADGGEWGIVEVDTDLLDLSFMLPDEDFLEQASRGQRVFGMRRHKVDTRTRWYRDHLLQFQHHWQDSIEGLGNCAYHGCIAPSAITRISLYTPASNSFITGAARDSSISVTNYTAPRSHWYRRITSWFFEPLSGADIEVTISSLASNTYRNDSRRSLRDRSGLQTWVHGTRAPW